LEDIVESKRFNAYDVEKVKTQPELQIRLVVTFTVSNALILWPSS
jgi:hypothetical protein